MTELTNQCRDDFVKWCLKRGFIINWRRPDGTVYEAVGLKKKYEIWQAAWQARSEYLEKSES